MTQFTKRLTAARWHGVPPAALPRCLELLAVELDSAGHLPLTAQLSFRDDGLALVTLDRGSVLIAYGLRPDVVTPSSIFGRPRLRVVRPDDVARVTWKPARAGAAA